MVAGGERADPDAYLIAPDRVRERRRRRLPVVRGGVRAGHHAIPLRQPRRGDRAGQRASRFGLSAAVFTTSLATADAVRRRAPGRDPSRELADRRRRRARPVRRHQGIRLRARTSRAARRSSSTPRRSPSTRMPDQSGSDPAIPRRLVGRRAIVTGAGAGIGRAIAIRLSAEGARVMVADVTPTPPKESPARSGHRRSRTW